MRRYANALALLRYVCANADETHLFYRMESIIPLSVQAMLKLYVRVCCVLGDADVCFSFKKEIDDKKLMGDGTFKAVDLNVDPSKYMPAEVRC